MNTKSKTNTRLAALRCWLARLVRNGLEFEGFAFTDSVSGESVYYYWGSKGQRWMKNSRWGSFKAKANP
jgi:beta-glucosidase-like glycosyl hydrolase